MKRDRTPRRRKVLGAVLPLLIGITGMAVDSDVLVRSTPAIAQTTQDQKTEAKRLLRLGFQQASKSEFRAALENFQKALVLFREVGDRAGEGVAVNNIGAIYNSLGQYSKALDFYQQALAIYKDIGDRTGEGITLNNIGFIYGGLGQYPKALDFYQQALAIYKDIGDRAREGVALNNIGGIYDSLGQYPKALDFYQQALAIRKDIGDRAGEGATLNNIGFIYTSLGQYPKALDFYQQALAIRKDIGDRAGEGVILNNIGLIYRRLGRYPKALDFYQQALAILKDIGDRAGEGAALNNISGIYSSLGQYPKALDFYQQALAIYKDIGNRAGEGVILNNIGFIYRSLGQYPKALDFYQQALTIYKDIDDRAGEGTTLNNIGYLFNIQKQPELAIIFYKKSVSVYESIRQDIRTLPKEQQQSYTETVASTYRDLVDILFKQNRVLEGQQVLDLLKIQELEAYLRNTRGINEPLIVLRPEQEILKRYDVLQQGAIAVGRELAELEKLPPNTLTPEQQKRKETLRQLRQDLNRQFNQFANSPEVREYLKQLTPTEIEARIPFDELRAAGAKMAELKAVLFYPAVFNDRLEVVITLPNAQPLRRTVKGVGRKELNAAIAQFRKALQDPTTDPKPIAQKLYNWLIKPIESDLEQAKKQANVETIIYAPDGQLRYIPLAALHNSQTWLIQNYRINNITAKAIDNLTIRPQSQPRILAGAFGNTSKTVEVAGRSFSFAGLKFATPEVQQLSKLVPNTRTMFAQSFTPEATIRQMNDFSIVHLATHAKLVPEDADQSFILFGNGTVATLEQIDDWTLNNVDLVVLSACETGLGGKFGENGEEVLGLGYQFTKKDKAKAAIASLWQVDDGGTEALMNEFYAALRAGKSKAQALQQAQIAMITKTSTQATRRRSDVTPEQSLTEPSPNHPYYWAPFILIGNGL